MTDASGASMPTGIRLAQGGQGYFGQLQGAQEPLSAAEQGPKQDGLCRWIYVAARLCRYRLPYLAVPTDALGGKTVPGQRPVSRAYRHISATCLRTFAGRFTLAVRHRREWPCLLRQYFPGGISFRKITEAMVVKAAEQLNNRPRKCLHYQTPAEFFNQALTGAFAI